MPKSKATILSTRAIDHGLIKDAALKNVIVEAVRFIKTEPVSSIETQQEIEQVSTLTATVIFTSANAVRAVTAELNGYKPEWSIFCIGHATRQLSEIYFGKNSIAATADNAKDLAHAIIGKGDDDQVVFFCGDRRRKELPQLLRQNNIDVNEIVVYQTIAVSRKVEKKYNGILFFSPSAVQSFFQSNQLDDQTILFAIGNSTAAEIKKYSKNKLVVSDEPKKELLLAIALNYFEANPIHH